MLQVVVLYRSLGDGRQLLRSRSMSHKKGAESVPRLVAHITAACCYSPTLPLLLYPSTIDSVGRRPHPASTQLEILELDPSPHTLLRSDDFSRTSSSPDATFLPYVTSLRKTSTAALHCSPTFRSFPYSFPDNLPIYFTEAKLTLRVVSHLRRDE